MNALTLAQALQMIEDLLKDTIGACKEGELEMARGVLNETCITWRLNRIKEDSKLIYHLLDSCTTINSQASQTNNFSNDITKRLFDYDAMMKKMGEKD